MLSIPKDDWQAAINTLLQRLGSALAFKSTPISTFKGSYPGVLQEADQGTVQVISQGRKRYVILAEEQLVEIMFLGPTGKSRSLADNLASLTPPGEQLNSNLVRLAGSEHDSFSLPDLAH